MSKLNETETVLENVQLAYCRLFTPEIRETENHEQKKVFSTCILIKKDDEKNIKRLKAIHNNAEKRGENGVFAGGRLVKKYEYVRDGDGLDSQGKEKPNFLKGHYYINVKTVLPNFPIVDSDMTPIIEERKIYPGVIVNIAINAYPFKVKGKIGVTFSLLAVQKVADSDPFSTERNSPNRFFKLIETKEEEKEDLPFELDF